MTTVLAAVDDSTAAEPVLALAQAIAETLHASVDVVHVRTEGEPVPTDVAAAAGVELLLLEGDPVNAIVAALDDPSILLTVVGSRGEPAGPRPVGHVAMAVVEGSDKPVLVVSPETRDARAPIRRVLVPLEGTKESTEAMHDALRRFADAGVELTALHVFDAESVPRFWDEPTHAEESYATAFASQWCTEPGVDVHLRRGSAPERVVEVAEAEHADLIALAWSRQLEPGRANVVRAALASGKVPVLLVPIADVTATRRRPTR